MCYIVFIPYDRGINRSEGRIGVGCLLVGLVTLAGMGPVTAVVTVGSWIVRGEKKIGQSCGFLLP